MQTGSAFIARVEDQLKYVGHLIEDTLEMYNNYEKEANDSASDLLKGFGDIVSFDTWGNYEVNMSLYNKLSNEKKELLDESLDAYIELIEERDKYYESYLSYIKQQIDLNQEMVDKYITAEDTLVAAVKEREQKILDAKLAAIDKEIKAIDKVVEARRKAREKESDSEELSGLQTDLQRSLMDSSGASASQILDLQKQIKKKQQEIADNSFDQMVDDLKTQLEDEKKLEQDLFDERLEEMDWYWAEVDRIMGDGIESVLDVMKMFGSEYNQASEIQQIELLKGWTDTFDQALTLGNIKVKELQDLITKQQEAANGLVVDENIITDATKGTAFDKRPETEEDKPQTGGTGNSGGSGNWSNSYSPSTGLPNGGGNSNGSPSAPQVNKHYSESSYGNQHTGGLKNSGAYVAVVNKDGVLSKQTLWQDTKTGARLYWKGKEGKYKQIPNIRGGAGIRTGQIFTNNHYDPWKSTLPTNMRYAFKTGGLADFTGPAWLDGTNTKPEAVLTA